MYRVTLDAHMVVMTFDNAFEAKAYAERLNSKGGKGRYSWSKIPD